MSAMEFNKCPRCESEKKFCKALEDRARAGGLLKAETHVFLEKREMMVIDADIFPLLKVGTRIPIMRIETDICGDCGTIYATRLEVVETAVTKEALMEHARQKAVQKAQGHQFPAGFTILGNNNLS